MAAAAAWPKPTGLSAVTVDSPVNTFHLSAERGRARGMNEKAEKTKRTFSFPLN